MDAHGQMFHSAGIVISAFLSLIHDSSPEFISDELLTILVNQFNKLELDGLNCLLKLKGFKAIIENDDDSKHGAKDDIGNDIKDEIGSIQSVYDYKVEDKNTDWEDLEACNWGSKNIGELNWGHGSIGSSEIVHDRHSDDETSSESTAKDDLESVIDCYSPNNNAENTANVKNDSDRDEMGYNGIALETCQSEDMVDVKDVKNYENYKYFDDGINGIVANTDNTEIIPESEDKISDQHDNGEIEIEIVTDDDSEETYHESEQLNSESKSNYDEGAAQSLKFSEAYYQSNLQKLRRSVRKRSQSASRSGLEQHNGTLGPVKRAKLQEMSLPKIPKNSSKGLPDIRDAVETRQLDLSYHILAMAAQIRQRDIKSKINDLEDTLKKTEAELEMLQQKFSKVFARFMTASSSDTFDINQLANE